MIISFIACLILFLLVGVLSIRHKKNTNLDYLLAGRDLPAWMAGLSAVATTNSGFMFTGWIGLTFMLGVSSIWFMLGMTTGSFLAMFFMARQIRDVSEERQLLSYGSLISNWFGNDYKVLQRAVGAVTFLFMASYAAAQLAAGGKALYALFGWSHQIGALMGTFIILLYCFTGGLRASVWSDTVQAVIMTIAMAVLLGVGLNHFGGPTSLLDKLHSIDPKLTNILPSNSRLGWPLYALGWVFGGFGVVGQPHIMVRFMSMSKNASIPKALGHYFSWYVAFFFISYVVGLIARAYTMDPSGFDAELALPTIATALLPQILVGVILAGLFAASMSTADSLVIASSATLIKDLLAHKELHLRHTKTATLGITLLAFLIAIWGNQSVFALVTFSWAVMASAFAPLLLLYVCGYRPTQGLALAMAGTGILVSMLWRINGLNSAIFEAMPGILAAFVVFAIGSRFRR